MATKFLFSEAGLFATSSLVFLFVVYRRKRKVGTRTEYINPSIQSLKRLSAHVPLCAFSSEHDARRYVLQLKCSPFAQCLSGDNTVWKFKLFRTVEEAFESLESAQRCRASSAVDAGDTDDDDLVTVSVPGHWQLQVCPVPRTSSPVHSPQYHRDSPPPFNLLLPTSSAAPGAWRRADLHQRQVHHPRRPARSAQGA